MEFVERVVLRLIADATMYYQVMDAVVRNLIEFGRFVGRIAPQIGTALRTAFASVRPAVVSLAQAFAFLGVAMVRSVAWPTIVASVLSLGRALHVVASMSLLVLAGFNQQRAITIWFGILSVVGAVGRHLMSLVPLITTTLPRAFAFLFFRSVSALAQIASGAITLAENLTRSLGRFAASVGAHILAVFGTNFGQLGQLFTALGQLGAAAFGAIVAVVRAQVLPILGYIIQPLRTTLPRVWADLVAAFQLSFPWITREIRNITGAVTNLISRMASVLGISLSWGDVFKGLGKGLMAGFAGVLATITTTLGVTLVGALIAATVAFGAFAAAMAVAFVEAIKQAAQYEQIAAAFETMTGSAEKAKEIIDQINTLAVESPFRSPELLAGAKQLKSFGIETDQIIPALAAMGQVAAGTSTPMERIIRAFGQVRVATRLMGTELRQFTDAGVPLIEYLAVVMKKPEQAIKGLVEEGQVSFSHVVEAFNKMTQSGGIFAGMMQRQSQTVAGRWSAMVENMQLALRDVGLAFFKGFRLADLLDEFVRGTDSLQDRVQGLVPIFERLRRIFDIARLAVSALASILLGDFKRAVESLLSGESSWEDFEKAVVGAIEAIIVAIGNFIDFLKFLVRTLATDVIKPIAEAMEQMGPKGKKKELSFGDLMVLPAHTRALIDLGMREALPVEDYERSTEAANSAGRVMKDLANSLEKLGQAGNVSGSWIDEFRNRLNKFQQKPIENQLAGQATLAQIQLARQLGLKQYEEMRKLPILDPAAMKLADDIQKEMREGLTAGEKFARNMQLIAEAEAFRPARDVARAGLIGGVAGVPGVLDQDAADFGRFLQFEELKKSVGLQTPNLPPAALAGTQEAQNAINEAQNKQVSIEAQILSVLEAERKMSEQAEKRRKETVDVLKKLEARGIVLKKRGIGGPR